MLAAISGLKGPGSVSRRFGSALPVVIMWRADRTRRILDIAAIATHMQVHFTAERGGYVTTSRNASPSRTTCPAVGAAKCVPITSVGVPASFWNISCLVRVEATGS